MVLYFECKQKLLFMLYYLGVVDKKLIVLIQKMFKIFFNYLYFFSIVEQKL